MFKKLILALTLLSPLVVTAQIGGHGGPGVILYDIGQLASPPACTASYKNFRYYDTDDDLVYYCNGSAWTVFGGASAFSGITSGTNTTATMTCGAGCTITFASTGIINANQLNGVDTDMSGAAEDDVATINSSGDLALATPGLTARTDADGTAQLATTDNGKMLIVTHATATAVDNVTVSANYAARLHVGCSAGPATFTPASGTVNGNTTLTLSRCETTILHFDGTNWNAIVDRNFSTLTYLHYGAAATLADSDDVPDIWIAKFPITITQICGRADTGTSTFNIQRDDGSAASIAASNIVADTTEACTSTFTAGENIISTGHALDFLQVQGATSGSPTRITVTISYVRR